MHALVSRRKNLSGNQDTGGRTRQGTKASVEWSEIHQRLRGLLHREASAAGIDADLLLDEAERQAGTVRFRFRISDPKVPVVSLLRVVIESTDVAIDDLEAEFGTDLCHDALFLAQPLFCSEHYREHGYEKAIRTGSRTVKLLWLAGLIDQIGVAATQREISKIVISAMAVARSSRVQHPKIVEAVQVVIEAADRRAIQLNSNRSM